jgi:glycosyltransferase involved in cell wall biosynthesis
MIGRMIPGKGFDVFARSLASCAARIGRPLVGLAIGDGPERARIEALAASLPGPARFVFAGYRRDVTALLGLCSAVLFPSQLTEVLPMALIEASAAGVPIVCSDIPGNREVVSSGVNGELAGPAEESYAEALARVLRDEAWRGAWPRPGAGPRSSASTRPPCFRASSRCTRRSPGVSRASQLA